MLPIKSDGGSRPGDWKVDIGLPSNTSLPTTSGLQSPWTLTQYAHSHHHTIPCTAPIASGGSHLGVHGHVNSRTRIWTRLGNVLIQPLHPASAAVMPREQARYAGGFPGSERQRLGAVGPIISMREKIVQAHGAGDFGTRQRHSNIIGSTRRKLTNRPGTSGRGVSIDCASKSVHHTRES